jgi:uncharacterized protein YybS (DUF2232 family)
VKRNATAFFIIALVAELGTTWLQRFRTTTDVAPGLYYPNFETLLLERLFFWFIIVAVLGTAWLLISKRAMRE